jgi:hypothetical protein
MAKTQQKMKQCEFCGQEFARERLVERLKSRVPQVSSVMDLCPACRRARSARLQIEGRRAQARTKGRSEA